MTASSNRELFITVDRTLLQTLDNIPTANTILIQPGPVTNVACRMHGQLTIGLLYYAIDDYFSEFLDNFQKKYPGIQLQFRSYVPQQLLDDLRQHKVDIATLFYYDKSALADLRCVPIAKTSMVVMLHKDNPLNKQEQISLSDLVDYPLIELLNDAYSNEMTRQYLSKSALL